MKILKKLKKNHRGFTLIELIVVIAILGILAAILVPSIMGIVGDARDQKDQANARSVYSSAVAAQAMLYAQNKTVTDTAVEDLAKTYLGSNFTTQGTLNVVLDTNNTVKYVTWTPNSGTGTAYTYDGTSFNKGTTPASSSSSGSSVG